MNMQGHEPDCRSLALHDTFVCRPPSREFMAHLFGRPQMTIGVQALSQHYRL